MRRKRTRRREGEEEKVAVLERSRATCAGARRVSTRFSNVSRLFLEKVFRGRPGDWNTRRPVPGSVFLVKCAECGMETLNIYAKTIRERGAEEEVAG